jgi:hypothetical protein
MPYTKQKDRDAVTESGIAKNVGDLTFQLTQVCIKYLTEERLTYQRIAEVRAALGGTLTEIDRRVAFPYEDRKIRENGDVFPVSLLG